MLYVDSTVTSVAEVAQNRTTQYTGCRLGDDRQLGSAKTASTALYDPFSASSF
jgi:hypothetical protein